MSSINPKQAVQNISTEEAFIIFIKFLMFSKHRVIELGSNYGLTAMQTLTLFLLDRPCPMHSLRKAFNCDASNITGLIDGLEQKELASRYESPEDRRIKMVRLEQRGREIRRSLLHLLGKQDSPILTKLSPKEYDTFIGLLQKVTQEA